MARLHETLPRGDEPAGSAPGSGSARRPVPLVGFLSRLLLPGRAAVPSIRAPGTAGGAERANRLRTDVLQRDSRHRSDREADRRLRAHLRNYICRRAFSALSRRTRKGPPYAWGTFAICSDSIPKVHVCRRVCRAGLVRPEPDPTGPAHALCHLCDLCALCGCLYRCPLWFPDCVLCGQRPVVPRAGGAPAPRAGAGGSVPPSARIFMFSSAVVNCANLRALSASRAASSASIELSKNRV